MCVSMCVYIYVCTHVLECACVYCACVCIRVCARARACICVFEINTKIITHSSTQTEKQQTINHQALFHSIYFDIMRTK